MRYSELKYDKKPSSIRKMMSILEATKTMHDRGNKKFNHLKKLFNKGEFFEEFSLSEGFDLWNGVKVGSTNTGIKYILLKSELTGKELRITPSKLMRRIECERFELEYREFKKRELKF